MTHVVTQSCIGCKDMSCASICPMECFHIGPEMLYINPDDCIDCEACVIECPVEAIFHEDDVPAQIFSDIELNAKMAQVYPVQGEH